jgi:hypothetical protein
LRGHICQPRLSSSRGHTRDAIAETKSKLCKQPRQPGALAGKIAIAKSFDTLPADVERALGIRDCETGFGAPEPEG